MTTRDHTTTPLPTPATTSPTLATTTAPSTPTSGTPTLPRRGVLTGAVGLVGAAGAVGAAGLVAAPAHARPADQRASAAAPRLTRDPFTLGVASGDPAPDGFVIWTRLAPDPVAADGLGGMPARRYAVAWQVALDDRFRRVVRAGAARTGPESAHAVHVELRGLEPGREYFYRFRTGAHASRTGRAVTAPAPGTTPAALTMAFASCSNFPAGWFTAYRRLAEDHPDLVLHLGDYQYEGAYRATDLRPHAGPETTTLAGYRQRLAQYKTDPDLQEAHAVAPWLVVWDDHEVDNNYAADVPEEKSPQQDGFLERRAAAYRAYYENMPLRRTSVPRGPDLQLFRRIAWGDLATFHMLDTRQYRSDQACGDGYDDCPDAADPARSLPGRAQEEWLAQGFRDSRAHWDLLGQQVFFGRRDNDPGAASTVSMDSWDGYPASRQRVVDSWVDSPVRNAVVLTGDVHAHWASSITRTADDPTSAPVGTEFVTTSITSGGDGYDQPDGTHPWAAWNPNLTFWTNLRGYVRTRITADELAVDHRCVPRVTTPDAPVLTRRSWVVESGSPVMHVTADHPLAAPAAGASGRSGRARPRTDAEIVADTLRAEGAA